MRASTSTRHLLRQIPRSLRLSGRSFHSSTSNAARRRIRPTSTKPGQFDFPLSKECFPAYTAEEKKKLSKDCTPAELAAIEAGEKAIDPEDIATQGVWRGDNYSLNYLDDFRTIDPVIDKQPRAPESNHDPNWRYKTQDEIARDMANWAQNLPNDADRVEWTKFLDNVRLTVGKEESERNQPSYEAPELPRFVEDLDHTSQTDESIWTSENMNKLLKQMGRRVEWAKALRIKTVWVHRIANQTRMGKIRRLYVVAIAGNQKGLVGLGEGVGVDIEDAQTQAVLRAIRSLKPIPRYENRTIYGDLEWKLGAAVVKLFNRPPGFGLRCQHVIFEICRCCGISDLSARVPRSRNPMNVAKATIQALMNQKLPEEIARARGIKLVDVRKVYYNGMV